MKEKFKVALAQISPYLGEVEKNIEKMKGLILEAKRKECEIIIFPEMSLTGYYLRDLVYELSETIPGKSFDELRKEAMQNSIHLVFGMPERKSHFSEIIYNSAVWIKPDGEYAIYRKIYLPTYRIFEEQKYFRNGSKPVFVDTEFGRFGLTICFDAYFPELNRYLALKDCHTVVNISASPSPSKNYFETLIKARAMENTLNMIYVNCTGVQEGINFWGGSFAVNPKGEILAKAKYYEEDFIVLEMNLAEILASKKNRPILRHVNKEIFKLCYEAVE